LVGIIYCLTQLVQTFEDENESKLFIKIQLVFSEKESVIAA